MSGHHPWSQLQSEKIRQEIADLGLNHEANRIDWHTYWLNQADLASLRSPDARTKCGCVIVSQDNSCVSMGYNGGLMGIDDSAIPNFEYNDRPVLSKTFIHSEENAIINAARLGHTTKDCVAYITGFPCVPCYMKLYNAGITHIYIPENLENCKPSVCEGNTYKEHIEYYQYLTDFKLPIDQIKCINLITRDKV